MFNFLHPILNIFVKPQPLNKSNQNKKIFLMPYTIPDYVYDFNDYVAEKYGAGNVGRSDKFHLLTEVDEWMNLNNYVFDLDEIENDRYKNELIVYIKGNWDYLNRITRKYYVTINNIYSWMHVANKKDAKDLFDKLERRLMKANNFDCRSGFYMKSKDNKIYQLVDKENKEVKYR